MAEADDLNIFMMCSDLNRTALTDLPAGFLARPMQPDEFEVWKRFPFDSPTDAVEFDGYMNEFFAAAYSRDPDMFFASTLFVCDPDGTPVATCGLWRAYDEFTTLQWLKTRPDMEGLGIGRALLSLIVGRLQVDDFPIYLHTQAGSFRAVKLYNDLGFRIVENDVGGPRPNEYREAMRHLKTVMPPDDFARLQTTRAPRHFEDVLARVEHVEF